MAFGENHLKRGADALGSRIHHNEDETFRLRNPSLHYATMNTPGSEHIFKAIAMFADADFGVYGLM